MNSLLIVLFIALFLCAILIGAARSPKAKGVVDQTRVKRLGIYAAAIIALIIVVGLIKNNAS